VAFPALIGRVICGAHNLNTNLAFPAELDAPEHDNILAPLEFNLQDSFISFSNQCLEIRSSGFEQLYLLSMLAFR
jgi:hypothetical protein